MLQNINICDAQRIPPLYLAVRCGNAPAVKKLFYLGTDVSVVKADKNDAVRLERLKNEPERMEEYLNFKKVSTQKPLQNVQGVQFLFFPIF